MRTHSRSLLFTKLISENILSLRLIHSACCQEIEFSIINIFKYQFFDISVLSEILELICDYFPARKGVAFLLDKKDFKHQKINFIKLYRIKSLATQSTSIQILVFRRISSTFL